MFNLLFIGAIVEKLNNLVKDVKNLTEEQKAARVAYPALFKAAQDARAVWVFAWKGKTNLGTSFYSLAVVKDGRAYDFYSVLKDGVKFRYSKAREGFQVNGYGYNKPLHLKSHICHYFGLEDDQKATII